MNDISGGHVNLNLNWLHCCVYKMVLVCSFQAFFINTIIVLPDFRRLSFCVAALVLFKDISLT